MLARIGLTQLPIHLHGVIHGYVARQTFPIRQDVDGNIVNRGHELRMVEPDIPDLRRRNGNRHRPLHALDLADNVLDRVVFLRPIPVDRLVADDDAVDISIVLGERYGAFDLFLVVSLTLVDPRPERDAKAEVRRKLRHEFEPGCRSVGPDLAGIWRDRLQIRSDLRLGGAVDLPVEVRPDR